MVRLRTFQRVVGLKLGVELRGEPKGMRVLAGSSSASLAVLLKLLVDKGLITDAELADAYSLTESDSYDDEPADPAPGSP